MPIGMQAFPVFYLELQDSIMNSGYSTDQVETVTGNIRLLPS